jgi:protein required for attachment to host cells
MSKIGIVVADGRRARFITLAFRQEPPAPGSAPELVEHQDLSNPERTPPTLASSSDREGSDVDAQRRQHEFLRRFARRLLEQVRLFIADPAIEQLILVAEPHLLGVARLELEHEPLRRVRVSQLAAELSRHSSLEIAQMLTLRGLLPATWSPHPIQPLPHGVSSCPASESSSQMAPAPGSSPSSHGMS